MKKGLYITLAVIMAVSLASCGTSAMETATPSAPAETPGVVTFADPVLEAMVRKAMGKPEGEITIAEAEALTELKLGIEWQQHIPEETQIKDLSGLEYFTNLKNLELSFHAVTDITPLAGLTTLESLSLGGNPVADIAPLSDLTNLGFLTLFNCQAKDYTPLANLVNLGGLLLDYSTISDTSMLSGLTSLWWLSLAHTQVSDVTPLATLINLKKLQLADCPITDYSPLADIYPNLKEKDFTMASSLKELGFTRHDGNPVAEYQAEGLTVTINHSEWGTPAMDAENNCVKMYLQLDSGYTLIVMYYPEIDAWVFQMVINNGMVLNYIYDSGSFNLSSSDRESAEQIMEAALGETDAEDILLAPIPIFNDTIESTFGMSADALYALPFEPLSLKSLGFTADEANAVCVYEQHEGTYTSIAIHRPEWGEQDYDVQFFTPLSDEYRIVVSYIIDERKFIVKADDNDEGGAAFEYFIDTSEHVDVWCSKDEMTVKEYFINAYNDPGIEDIYLHSVQLMEQYISNTFGMSIDELYALPVGE